MGHIFLSWTALFQYAFYLLLILLPVTAWRKQEKVGKVYGLLLLTAVLHEIFKVLAYSYAYTIVLESAQEVMLYVACEVTIAGIHLGGVLFLLLLVGVLYQHKRKRDTKKLKKWAVLAFVVTIILLGISCYYEEAFDSYAAFMHQIIINDQNGLYN
jgi:heme A synthase